MERAFDHLCPLSDGRGLGKSYIYSISFVE